MKTGLGKTLQTIALVCHIKEQYGASGPSLVVCPLSVLYSWCNEIERWAPSLKFRRFHCSNPESMSADDLDLATLDIVGMFLFFELSREILVLLLKRCPPSCRFVLTTEFQSSTFILTSSSTVLFLLS